MSQIDLISALRLILRFADSPEVVNIIQQTLNELERLRRLEEIAIAMASIRAENLVDTDLIDEVAKLTGANICPDSTIRNVQS